MSRQSEKGFTLIEVTIVVAILGIIMLAMAMSTTSLLTNQQKASDHTVVLHQVQNAGYWISRDVQMANNVFFEAPGFPLTLEIPVDTNPDNDYSIDYLFDSNELKRQVYDPSHALTSETFIARYLDTQGTTFSTVDSNTYNLIVKAVRGDVVLEENYKVSRRPSSS